MDDSMASINIAIDGPAGAGKSSVAKAVAQALGIMHLDTGAMYRAVGLAALRAGADPTSEAAVAAVLADCVISVEPGARGQRTLLNGKDVSTAIRSPEASQAASQVAALPAVRTAMQALQRDMARVRGIAIDGRDIGIRVLPEAPVKLFITASPEARARRRWKEMKAAGDDVPYGKLLDEIKRRDERDTTRAVDPLRPAEDAVIIDTTNMPLKKVVEKALEVVRLTYGDAVAANVPNPI